MSYQREFEKKLNVALIGAGSHAYRNLLPALNFLPVRLRAVCDINTELAEKTAQQYGAKSYGDTKELFSHEDLDAVMICVSPQLHPELTCEALDAGLNVWMEKPPAMRAFEVEEMLRQRKDRVVMVGFKKIFMPATRKVMEILSHEEYLPLKSILGEFGLNIPDKGEEVLRERQMNGWAGGACHPLSMMLAIGGQVEAVMTHRSKHGGAVCLFAYESGAVGNLHVSDSHMSQPLERFEFFGNGCRVAIDNGKRVTFKKGIPFSYGAGTTFAPEGLDSGATVWEPQNSLATLETKMLFTQGFYNELKCFFDCVMSGEQPTEGSLEFALDLMKVYEATLISEDNWVKLT
ncbi:MAG: Gfo/Idh/MocA family oxidoreductase [Planctomycetota bacterium]|jgi:predicted dehydrogenase|nr:Gfo/Idh/MocA family oxidoreductase [Planctomycetota bacterium]